MLAKMRSEIWQAAGPPLAAKRDPKSYPFHHGGRRRSTPPVLFSVLFLVLFIHLIGFPIYIFCLFKTFVAGTI